MANYRFKEIHPFLIYLLFFKENKSIIIDLKRRKCNKKFIHPYLGETTTQFVYNEKELDLCFSLVRTRNLDVIKKYFDLIKQYGGRYVISHSKIYYIYSLEDMKKYLKENKIWYNSLENIFGVHRGKCVFKHLDISYTNYNWYLSFEFMKEVMSFYSIKERKKVKEHFKMSLPFYLRFRNSNILEILKEEKRSEEMINLIRKELSFKYWNYIDLVGYVIISKEGLEKILKEVKKIYSNYPHFYFVIERIIKNYDEGSFYFQICYDTFTNLDKYKLKTVFKGFLIEGLDINYNEEYYISLVLEIDNIKSDVKIKKVSNIFLFDKIKKKIFPLRKYIKEMRIEKKIFYQQKDIKE